jgi:glycosyltransferase A (GT-A) superfamily protein (DUF2064 family)
LIEQVQPLSSDFNKHDMMPPNRRAVLLFTRSPESEAKAKPLSSRLSKADRVRLYTAFIRRVSQEAARLELPILIATDEPDYNFRQFSERITTVFMQQGNSFGDKLDAALSDAFSLGYDDLVIIGNDSPALDARDLAFAFSTLQHSPAVIGTATDGGVSLLGFTQRGFAASRSALQTCRWETGFVTADLTALLAPLGLSRFASTPDIDTASDLIFASQMLRDFTLLARLAQKLCSPFLSVVRSTPVSIASARTLRLRYQKAPPVR